MVSAFSAANQVVLGQVKTAEKSNEITAIPELLEILNIRGCLVTIDAMGCQKAIAKKILDKEADYCFKLEMLQSDEGDTYSTKEQGHGRIETRLCLVNDDLSVLGDIAFEWPELKTMGIVATIRQEKGQPATGIALRYYISSAKLTSKQLLDASRAN